MKVIGQIKLDIDFGIEKTYNLKFLVTTQLTYQCIINREGMTALNIKDEVPQGLVWVDGYFISANRSKIEFKILLNSLDVIQGFKYKIDKFNSRTSDTND
eukprot:NODE_307_length_10180_cov_0.469596.p2 type:complete len:100 gc:universal NODE_307_length_10180_cov_0.469596:3651-3352(-)